MRKFLVSVSLIFLLMGLGIFVSDAYTSYRYGVHWNEVAAITDDGLPIDWPTGERPAFTMIPLFVYGLGFMLAAAGVFTLKFGNYTSYRGRIRRGTQ